MDTSISYIQYNYNTTQNNSLGHHPFDVFLGFQPTLLDIHYPMTKIMGIYSIITQNESNIPTILFLISKPFKKSKP